MTVKPEEAYGRVEAARAKDRPLGRDYIDHLISDFTELHGDRRFPYLCSVPVPCAADEPSCDALPLLRELLREHRHPDADHAAVLPDGPWQVLCDL